MTRKGWNVTARALGAKYRFYFASAFLSRELFLEVLLVFCWASSLSVFEYYVVADERILPRIVDDMATTVLSSVSTLLFFMITFRSSETYGRWWEARQLWGGLIYQSWTIVQQACTWIDDEAVCQRIADHVVAFGLLSQALLHDSETVMPALDGLLAPAELEFIASIPSNRPLYCLDVLRACAAKGLSPDTPTAHARHAGAPAAAPHAAPASVAVSSEDANSPSTADSGSHHGTRCSSDASASDAPGSDAPENDVPVNDNGASGDDARDGASGGRLVGSGVGASGTVRADPAALLARTYAMEEMIASLGLSLGGCIRVRNAPVPSVHTSFQRTFALLYCLIAPLASFDATLGPYTILTTTLSVRRPYHHPPGFPSTPLPLHLAPHRSSLARHRLHLAHHRLETAAHRSTLHSPPPPLSTASTLHPLHPSPLCAR
jgi:predicted membrane chloride channel (bestrophin family)